MNKNILITSASIGIGVACAEKFAQNGDNVILFATSNASVYCATKHAVKAISEGLRYDLLGKNALNDLF